MAACYDYEVSDVTASQVLMCTVISTMRNVFLL